MSFIILGSSNVYRHFIRAQESVSSTSSVVSFLSLVSCLLPSDREKEEKKENFISNTDNDYRCNIYSI